jgi:hypothetical protein
MSSAATGVSAIEDAKMTEKEWLATSDPYDITHHKSSRNDRKRRLMVCACVQRGLAILADGRFAAAVAAAEEFADGTARWSDLVAARKTARAARDELEAAGGREHELDVVKAVLSLTEKEFMYYKMALESMQFSQGCRNRSKWDSLTDREAKAQTRIGRDIFGNPFRPVDFDSDWRTSTVVALAKQMYDSRDFSAMPILADALQDAGCENDDVLNHCRDAAGVHVRGCWVVDLVLGKS